MRLLDAYLPYRIFVEESEACSYWSRRKFKCKQKDFSSIIHFYHLLRNFETKRMMPPNIHVAKCSCGPMGVRPTKWLEGLSRHRNDSNIKANRWIDVIASLRENVQGGLRRLIDSTCRDFDSALLPLVVDVYDAAYDKSGFLKIDYSSSLWAHSYINNVFTRNNDVFLPMR